MNFNLQLAYACTTHIKIEDLFHVLPGANDYFDAVVRRKEIPLVLTNDETGSLPVTCASTVALTADDYARAAQDLDVEAAALQAVAMTESGAAGGFGVDGRPTLCFELHVFQKS